jgi:hypothetical protein
LRAQRSNDEDEAAVQHNFTRTHRILGNRHSL